MNGKIPVFGAVASAYGFLFGHFMTIVRMSWVWLLAAAALQFMWGPGVEAAMLEFQKTQNPETIMPVMGQAFGMGIVGILAQIIVFVALLRVVISGDDRPGVPLHLFSGMPDLRLIGALILLFIAFAAAVFAFAILTGFVGAATGPAGAGILGIVFALALIYVALGLSLVAPVAAVEANLGVERSWELMKGNRLRMFFAALLTFLPLGLLLGAAFVALILPAAGPFPDMAGQTPEAMNKALEEYTRKIEAVLKQDYGLFVAGSLVLGMISLGLQAGLYGRAYRAAANMDG